MPGDISTMNNAGGPQGQQGPSPQQQQQLLAKVIRVEQVAGLRHLNDAGKKHVHEIVKKLWDEIQGRSPTDDTYQASLKRLFDVTQKLRQDASTFIETQKQGGANQAQGGQQPTQRPQPQGQQNQQQRPISGQPQNSQQVNAAMNPSVPFTLPPSALPGTPEGDRWLAQVKTRYMQANAKQQEAFTMLNAIKSTSAQRQESGNPFSPEEIKEWTTKGNDAKRVCAEMSRVMQGLRALQKEFSNKAQQGGSQVLQQINTSATGRGFQQSLSSAQQIPNTKSQASSSVSVNPQNANSSLDQPHIAGNNPMSPTNSVQQAGQLSADQQQSLQHMTTQAAGTVSSQPTAHQFSQQSQSLSTHTAIPQNPQHQLQQHPNSQHNSPQSAQPHSAAQHIKVEPLSHSAAIAQAAQTYANSYSQNNSQTSSMHSHPQVANGDRLNNNMKMPIPKTLVVAPTTAVSMGPARPTLSGGPSTGAAGMMGQPAIQKYPQYVLEGEGDRVLSKKKLDELVRQVTGGGEGLGGEGLTAEVEEAVLQVADDFVDQVITSACRLAKLRQSSTLEIRDIQVILERNYNIRVPGYASDEIRTVKKFQPAPGWSHKMQAINAAKVMGGKTDL